MTVAVFNEPLHPGAFIVSERAGFYSRDTGIIPAGQKFGPGTVLGATLDLTKVTATVAQATGNAGDGAITLDATAPVRGDAKDGVYTVEFLTAGATAEFNLLDPEGRIAGTGTVGTLFGGPLKFTIADDAAKHYGVGDRILITVLAPVTAIQFEALNPAATDGSQNAAAVAVFGADTTAGAAAQIAVLTREAEVRASDLTWPVGFTANQIAEGIRQLRGRGIITRT